MKKVIIPLLFFLLLFVSEVNAQYYLDWVNLALPINKTSPAVVFSLRERYFSILSKKEEEEGKWGIYVNRYDKYGVLEETRVKFHYQDGENLTLFNNYFTWAKRYLIIPFYNGSLGFITFNLTEYENGGSGIEVMPYKVDAVITDLIPAFTFHMPVGFDTDFNTPVIAYRGTDNRIHVLYNFFDIVNDAWRWDLKKDRIIDSGITYIKKGYVYPSVGGCRFHSDCFLYFVFEGRSQQNSDRYGIYVREIRKGVLWLEFNDIPLIGWTTYGCYSFENCYNDISYWRIGNDQLEANKILIREMEGQNFKYLFFKFNPYNWYKIEETIINTPETRAIQPNARNITMFLWHIEPNCYGYQSINYEPLFEGRNFFTVKFYAPANITLSIGNLQKSCYFDGVGYEACVFGMEIESAGNYSIGVRQCPRGEMPVVTYDIFYPIDSLFDQIRVITDSIFYQEAFVAETDVSLWLQRVGVPSYTAKITRTCEYNNTYPSNTLFICDIDDINIPSNAINISVKTSAKIYVVNGSAESPDKTFELKACSPEADVGGNGEKCEIKFLSCTNQGVNTEVVRYRIGLPGTTITSNVHANISLNCISPTGFPTWVGIIGKTEVEFSYVSPAEKKVVINAEPLSGNETTIFKIYLSTYNLAYPYVATMIVDGEEYDFSPRYDQNLIVNWNSYGRPGVHTIRFRVRDAENWVGTTDTITITVYGAGIAPFNLFVSPLVGNVTTIFRFSTSLIYNGTPPYTVVVFPIRYGEDAWIGRCILQSSGTCSFSTTLPCGNESYGAKVRDSVGNVMYSNPVTPYVECVAQGEPLSLSLEMSPTTGDTQTIFTLTLTVYGGAPPYYATWEDWGNMICYETYTSQPPFSVQRRFKFWSGSRGIDVHILSADGQSARSNRLEFDVAWAGEPERIAFDCTGIVGEGYSREALPTYPTYQQPLINQSALVSVGAGWMGAFFTPIFISTMMLIGISGLVTLSIAKYSGGDLKSSGAIFLGCVVLLSIIYAISGIYPAWLVIVFIIIAGLIFAKVIIGVI
ncbi:MAG: hypothetical protein ABIK75_07110 [candidate division WOR-3 bacterium]